MQHEPWITVEISECEFNLEIVVVLGVRGKHRSERVIGLGGHQGERGGLVEDQFLHRSKRGHEGQADTRVLLHPYAEPLERAESDLDLLLQEGLLHQDGHSLR